MSIKNYLSPGVKERKKNKKRKTKKNFIQEANKRSEKRGTVGSFRRWCKARGLITKEGKVTLKCIQVAKKSGTLSILRKALFAENIGGYSRKKK